VSQCDTFKIGDRIKVNAPYDDEYHGHLGKIMKVNHAVKSHRVLLDNGTMLNFETHELIVSNSQKKEENLDFYPTESAYGAFTLILSPILNVSHCDTIRILSWETPHTNI